MFGFDTLTIPTMIVLAGLNVCPDQQRVDVKVHLVTKDTPYITNVTSKWLTKKFGKDSDTTFATGEKWMVGGLTKFNSSSHFSMRFHTHTNQKDQSQCLAISDVSYTINYAPVVYIASDYKHLGCRYNQTLAHEKKHVQIGTRIYKQFIPEIREEIRKVVKDIPPQGPYPAARVAAEQQRIMQQVHGVTQPIIEKLHIKMRAEQAKIDTIENYRREAALCPGQYPDFKR